MLLRRIVLTLPLALACTKSQPVRKASPQVSGKKLRQVEEAIFKAVNQRRVEASIVPLVWSDSLAKEARRHSLAMLEGGFFSHRDPVRGDLKQRFEEVDAKRRWRRIAENIFQQSGAPDPVRAPVDGWMKSAGHRRNILDAGLTDSGVGVVVGAGGVHYATQIFARLSPD
jgi:uncharacterized protein YkwD